MSTVIEVQYTEQPTIIEITLYRHNWKDNQIIHTLKKNSNLLNIDKNRESFFVPFEDFGYLFNKYEREVSRFSSLSEDNMISNINSLYFMRNIFNNFTNLKYVKVNISQRRNYSRVVQDVYSFSVKLLYSKIVLNDYLTVEEKEKMIHLFTKIGIVTNSKIFTQTYVTIKISELLDKIEEYQGYLISESDPDDIVNVMLSFIDPKTELDNPNVLFIL